MTACKEWGYEQEDTEKNRREESGVRDRKRSDEHKMEENQRVQYRVKTTEHACVGKSRKQGTSRTGVSGYYWLCKGAVVHGAALGRGRISGRRRQQMRGHSGATGITMPQLWQPEASAIGLTWHDNCSRQYYWWETGIIESIWCYSLEVTINTIGNIVCGKPTAWWYEAIMALTIIAIKQQVLDQYSHYYLCTVHLSSPNIGQRDTLHEERRGRKTLMRVQMPIVTITRLRLNSAIGKG